MNKIIKNKNITWLFSILLISVLCAVGLFTFLFFAGFTYIKSRPNNPEFISQRNDREFEKLQEYVTDHSITEENFDKIDDYVYNNNILLILYNENGVVMYDSSYSINYERLANQDIRAWNHLGTNYRPVYTLKLGDKELKADFIYFYNIRLRFVFLTTVLFVCFLIVLFGILASFLRLMRYYTILTDDINRIIEGDIDHSITVLKGKGKMDSFVQSLERMRISIIEQGKKENEIVEANQKFVMSMSHDLRTPLTILIGYLEILCGKKYKNEEIKDIYIEKCKDKAYQIKELSDKLFQYFLTFNLREDTLNREDYNQSVIDELIGDYVFTLEEKGYNVNYSPDEGKGYIINMDILYIRRVVDNIFSNITKYADMGKPVSIDVFNNGKELILSFGNFIKQGLAQVESTNIGLLSSKRFVEEHKGSFVVEKNENQFKVTIRLPIIKKNEHKKH